MRGAVVKLRGANPEGLAKEPEKLPPKLWPALACPLKPPAAR
jgi:hypothetical protein